MKIHFPAISQVLSGTLKETRQQPPRMVKRCGEVEEQSARSKGARLPPFDLCNSETKIADFFWRVPIYILEDANLRFGGAFIEKDGTPKGGYFGFP